MIVKIIHITIAIHLRKKRLFDPCGRFQTLAAVSSDSWQVVPTVQRHEDGPRPTRPPLGTWQAQLWGP